MEQPEAAPDLVGRTSARLLAAGIERRERIEALHLLAILDASIDTSGRVRRPLDDLAAEFDLPPISVMRSLDHLVLVGAVQRDGAGVVLLGSRQEGLGGLQLADFLDDVRASFDGDVPRRRRSTLLARSGAVMTAVAAAIAVFTLAPSSGVQTPVALRDAAETPIADRLDRSDAVDAPDGSERTRRSRTSVAPTSTPTLETDVLAAASPSTTCPATPATTEVPLPGDITDTADDDLAACLDAHGLVITGVTLAGPTIEERTPVDPEPRADALAPVGVDDSDVVDVADDVDQTPAGPTTEHVARTIRS